EKPQLKAAFQKKKVENPQLKVAFQKKKVENPQLKATFQKKKEGTKTFFCFISRGNQKLSSSVTSLNGTGFGISCPAIFPEKSNMEIYYC
ncbi:MAG: hypothetical protein LBU37_02460, partial [Tannerellaceae bacterium]|nr:hypothetical protein [Tannerellaceae bacterium]